MPISVRCPHCSANLRVSDQGIQKELRCPKCSVTFRLAMSVAAVPVPPKPAPIPIEVVEPGNGLRPPPLPPQTGNPPAQPVVPLPPPAPPRREPIPIPEEDRTIMGQPAQRPPAARGRVLPPPLPAKKHAPPPDNESVVLPATRGSGDRAGSGMSRRAWIWGIACFLALGTGVSLYFFLKPGKQSGSAAAVVLKGKYGAIEIGNKGVKAVVVEFFNRENIEDYKIHFDQTTDVEPGKLDVSGTTFDSKALEDTCQAVKNYAEIMQRDHGVKLENIYVVRSSGLLQAIRVKAKSQDPADLLRAERDSEARIAKNGELLSEKIKALTSLGLDSVTVHDESRFGAAFVIPPQDRKDAMLIDIGGGNTKGGYYDDAGQFISMNLDYGVSTFFKQVGDETKKTGSTFETAASRLKQSSLVTPLREEATRKPALKNRKKIYLIGGAVWAMASFTHPESPTNHIFVTLKRQDIPSFLEINRAYNWKERTEKLADKVPDAETRAYAQEQIKNVKERLGPQDRLKAAGLILEALDDAMEFTDDKQLIFHRKSQYAWLMGYLMNKTGATR